jgi:hypothetical protein
VSRPREEFKGLTITEDGAGAKVTKMRIFNEVRFINEDNLVRGAKGKKGFTFVGEYFRFKDTGGDRVDTSGRSGGEVREREGAGGET